MSAKICYCIKRIKRACLNKISLLKYISQVVIFLAESNKGSVALQAAALAQLHVNCFQI